MPALAKMPSRMSAPEVLPEKAGGVPMLSDVQAQAEAEKKQKGASQESGQLHSCPGGG